jgi:transposase
MISAQSCIALDVSKGSSHVCAYTSKDNLIQTPIQILHDREGFRVLDQLVEKLNIENGSSPIFIYESTGIYHRPLKTYLTEKKYVQIEVSPLLAAKHRKNSGIRIPKSDKADPKSLARLFYDVDLTVRPSIDEGYYDLLQYDQCYQFLTRLMVTCKVHFKEKLDILFPRIEVSFNPVYTSYLLELFDKYPHPELILHKRSDALENELLKNGIQKSRVNSFVRQLKSFCQNCMPGSSSVSVDTMILRIYIQQIQYYIQERDQLMNKMINLVGSIPLYSQLQTIPGIGPLLAARLIAELGDLSRFDNSRQLTAYAGLDPVVYQSGQFEGKHLSISKKGNRHLRAILYQIIVLSTQVKHDHSLKIYVQNKKQTHSNKSANIAGCAKLLRIIFSLYRSNETYNF